MVFNLTSVFGSFLFRVHSIHSTTVNVFIPRSLPIFMKILQIHFLKMKLPSQSITIIDTVGLSLVYISYQEYMRISVYL